MFDSIASLAVAQNMRELFRLVLVDTPLAPYFSDNLTHEDLDEMNIEIMRNTLYKAYLDDFAHFCQGLGGATAEIMGDMLSFEVRTWAGGAGGCCPPCTSLDLDLCARAQQLRSSTGRGGGGGGTARPPARLAMCI